MAFSGFHVVFGYVGGSGREDQVDLFAQAVSSETLTSAGTTTIRAPGPKNGYGDPVAVIRSSVDAWISIGPSPADPALTTTTRELVPAGVRVDRFVDPGDYIRWAAA